MDAPATARPRRLLRRFALWLGGIAGVLVVLVALVLVALQTGPARAWLAAFLSERASAATGYDVRIGAIDGTLPAHIVLTEVEVADAGGPWLRASGVEIDWRPTALLAARLEVARTSVAALDILRPPAPAAEEAPSAPPSPPWAIELPTLSVAVALANLELPEIHLGPSLIGEEMTLGAFGSAALGDTPQSAEAALTVLRLDGVPARLDLTFAQAQPDGALTLGATVEEPAGGLIARLLDLPGLPALALRLAGSGPVDGWRGRLDATAGDASAHLDLTLAVDDRVDLTIAGDLDPGGLAGPELRELLPEPARVNAALAWTPGGALDVAHAELTAPGAAASLAGRLDFEADSVDARGRVVLDDAALVARLAAPATAAGLRAELQLGGGLAAPRLDIDATIDRPRGPGVVAQSVRMVASAAPAEDPARLAIEARITTEGLAIEQAAGLDSLVGPAPAISLVGDLDPADGGLDVARLDVTGSAIHVTGGGRVADAGRDLDLALALRLDDLAPFGRLARLPMQGGAAADIHLAGDATLPALDLELDLRGEGVDIANRFVGTLVGAAPHLVASVDLDGAVLQVESLVADTAAARLEARGTLADELDLALDVAAPDLDKLSPGIGAALAGSLSASGRMSGPLGDPAVSAEVEGQDVAIEGMPLGGVAGTVRASDLGGEPQGDLDLMLSPGGAPLRATSRFRVALDDNVRFEDLRLDGGGARIAGKVTVRPDDLLEAELAGEIADLSAWRRLAGTALGGALDFRLSASAHGGGQRATFAANGRDVALADAVTMQTLHIDADIADALAAPSVDGRLAAEGIAADTVSFAAVDATAQGRLTDLAWAVAATAADDDGAAIDAQGRLALGDGGGRVTLAALAARLRSVEATLARPATIAWDDAGLRVENVEAAVGDGRVRAAGRVGEYDMALDATLENLPVGPLAQLAGGPGLDGRLDGEIALGGDRAAPEGKASLRLLDLREAGVDPAEAVALAGGAEAVLARGRFEATGHLGGPEGFDLDARLSAPFAGDGAIDGEVAGSLDLALVPRIVDLRGDALEGTLDLDLALSGSLASPRASGRAGLRDGAYESAAQGTILRGLTADIVGDNDRVRLDSLAADDGNGGTVSATGALRVDPAAGFPLEGSIALDKFTALRRADATVQVSGALDIARNPEGGRIAGKVTVDSAELRVPDRLGGEVVTLEVTEINLPPGRERLARPPRQPKSPLDLDVDVEVPGRAFLRGRGLDSEWQGRLQVAGTTAAPDITGSLSVVRGSLDLLGRNFRFEQGEVTFVGGGAIDPELDITAQSEAEELTVRAAVSGTAKAPRFELSSDPPLPQDEILARLLFGGSASQLTPIQAVQLAQTAATLSGTGGSVSILDRLRQGVGLDVLGVESGATVAGSSLTVGKYLTDDVFVKASQGLTPESRRVGVEVRVLPRVTVESDVGAQSQGSVGVNWKLDY